MAARTVDVLAWFRKQLAEADADQLREMVRHALILDLWVRRDSNAGPLACQTGVSSLSPALSKKLGFSRFLVQEQSQIARKRAFYLRGADSTSTSGMSTNVITRGWRALGTPSPAAARAR